MQTIPDDVLDAITAHRPHLAAMARNLRANPALAGAIERDLATAYLAGETRLSATQTYHLAACAAGHPYGAWIDLDYAAHLSGFSAAHLRRLIGAGTLDAIKRRGEHYVSREAVEGLERKVAGRPRRPAD